MILHVDVTYRLVMSHQICKLKDNLHLYPLSCINFICLQHENKRQSDYDNFDVMLGMIITIPLNNSIERELADATEQSSVHGDANTNTYHREEYGNFSYENDSMRQNNVRQSFEALSNEFNLRLKRWTQ